MTIISRVKIWRIQLRCSISNICKDYVLEMRKPWIFLYCGLMEKKLILYLVGRIRRKFGIHFGWHESITQVTESKINLLVHENELFNMTDNETVSKCLLVLLTSYTGLRHLVSKPGTGTKILQSVARRWKQKVIAILEAKDLTILERDQLIGSLITHEVMNSNNDIKKKKDPALK